METESPLTRWEHRFKAFLQRQGISDHSHSLDHVQRVVASAKKIGLEEKADMAVVVPASWLHDCVVVEKNSPDRARASTLAADEARRYLEQIGYPTGHLEGIFHAIQAHSFSAQIPPETLEARVVQDADRLDALGAIGLVRCLMTGERLGLPLYHPDDPFARTRLPDDRQFILDHFYVKLFTLPDTMQTPTGRREARERVRFLDQFLQQLQRELPPPR